MNEVNTASGEVTVTNGPSITGSSDQVSALFAALAKAQGVLKDPIADSSNPAFKSKYADLSACLEAIRKPFSDNGLAILQPVFGETVVTMLVHEKGAVLQSSMPLMIGKRDMPGFKSAVTYARRTALQAVAGIADADDDAANASKTSQRSAPAANAQTTTASQQQSSPPPQTPFVPEEFPKDVREKAAALLSTFKVDLSDRAKIAVHKALGYKTIDGCNRALATITGVYSGEDFAAVEAAINARKMELAPA